MDIDGENGTSILHRKTGYRPKKSFQWLMIGRPLSTADAPHQTIGKLIGLAVFSSDAMSSVAYGPQEMLTILAVAGVSAFYLATPLAIAIAGLLAILILSYEQTIHTYPEGGGAYIVARDNLGEIPALVAAAALLSDYILTVSVSISSAVAQIVSAYPALYNSRVILAVGFVAFVMVINLRGVREAGLAFALPTYYFIGIMYLTVILGLIRMFSGTLGVVESPPEMIETTLQPLTIFLILRAFSNGTTALTGVEAISNGITAFKEPRSKNAGTTLIWMGCILGSLLLGITFLANQIGGIPSEHETIISQLTRTIFGGRTLLYLAAIGGTSLILVLAANTAYAGFPRLGAMVGIDGYLPRQLAFRGSRLVYSRGIIALAVISSLLIILFGASVSRLIPLYAIGVFLSFTLSQLGMARRWYKSGKLKSGEVVQEAGSSLHYDAKWKIKMTINGLGSLVTAMVAMIFAVTKFREGAWIVLIIIPVLVAAFLSIHRHYKQVAKKLSLEKYGAPPRMARHRVILTVGGVHRGTLEALRYAKNLSDDITAVHVSIDPDETRKIQQKWELWGDGVRLVILESPYRLFIEPLLEYVESIEHLRQPNEVISIIVPQFISRQAWTGMLHSRTADTLRKVLLNRSDIVITEVPYLVE